LRDWCAETAIVLGSGLNSLVLKWQGRLVANRRRGCRSHDVDPTNERVIARPRPLRRNNLPPEPPMQRLTPRPQTQPTTP